MFWSGNYIANKDLSSLLKEETINLTDVLEADNILQECKADNQALTKFLSRPEILSELIRLITEEPPKDVDLTLQYRHSTIACEVLASFTSKMKQLLVKNVSLLHRLCDFVNQEPPLNPLLASYFSKVIEVLLEKDPSQNAYVYRIVCLQVLDVFCSRPEFLPNLLRHMSTSAIAEVFKYFIRLEDYFYKGVMQWFEQHKLVDCLIQIVAGTYAMEESSIKLPPDQTPAGDDEGRGEQPPKSADDERACRAKQRMRTAAADNAEVLLRELILIGCVKDPYDNWSPVARTLATAVRAGVGRALSEWFSRPEPRTSPPAGLIVAALTCHTRTMNGNEQGSSEVCFEDRAAVEYCVAPHLPLIHQALMKDPVDPGDQGGATVRKVGSCRLALCSVLGELATSHVPEVPTTLLTLGTPGLLIDLFFSFPDNNFLHHALSVFVSRALYSPYAMQFATHFLIECDFLTKLMDAFEENERRSETNTPRAGYMGHVILLMSLLRRMLEQDATMSELVPEKVQERWQTFLNEKLDQVVHIHQTPLGGVYPSDNTYEEPAETEPETVYDNIDYDKDSFKMMDIDRNMDWSSKPDDADFDAVLEEVPPELLQQSSPWDALNQDSELSNEDWANFNDVFGNSGDPFANANEQTFEMPNQNTDNMNQDLETTNQNYATSLGGENKNLIGGKSLITQNEGFETMIPSQEFTNKLLDNSCFTNRRLNFEETNQISKKIGQEDCDKDGEAMNMGLGGSEQDDDGIDSDDFDAQSSPICSYKATHSSADGEDAAMKNLAKLLRSLNVSPADEFKTNEFNIKLDPAEVASKVGSDGLPDTSETNLGTVVDVVQGNIVGTNETEVFTQTQTHLDLTINAGSELTQTVLPDPINHKPVPIANDDTNSSHSSSLKDLKEASSSMRTDAALTSIIQNEFDTVPELQNEENVVIETEKHLDETDDLLAKIDKLLLEAATTTEKPKVDSILGENDPSVQVNMAETDPDVHPNIAEIKPSVTEAKFNPNVAKVEPILQPNTTETGPSQQPNLAESEPSER